MNGWRFLIVIASAAAAIAVGLTAPAVAHQPRTMVADQDAASQPLS